MELQNIVFFLQNICLFLGWNIDPCEQQMPGTHLLGMEQLNNLPAIDNFLHSLTHSYISNTIIPETNHQVKKKRS